MGTAQSAFSRHLLAFILIPLLILMAAASYYRFFVTYDYVVEYEADCDPTTASCYVGCEDDECSEVYYYVAMTKYAADLRAQCGPDITACEAAQQCEPGDRDCSAVYCDPGVEEDEACASIEGAPEDEGVPHDEEVMPDAI